MLGGGTYTVQNKILPGVYINFVSTAVAAGSAQERGICGIGLNLDWGKDDVIFKVSKEDFEDNADTIFGYDSTHDKLKGLRDLFKNAKELYAYKLTSGGKKASNDVAEALYTGIRGNDIKIVVSNDVDSTAFVVETYVDNVIVDTQTVTSAAELVANSYVTFKTGATLEASAGLPLAGGENGTEDTVAHQSFLKKLESYSDINAIGYTGTDKTISNLYSAFVIRLREKVGIKLQAVLYGNAADHEGVINVKNSADLVWWVIGITASGEINASNDNKEYDGEFEFNIDYTQAELEEAIKAGEFVVHNVNGTARVLEDINSLVTYTADKGKIFRDNQTVRVCDQIAVDIASIFVEQYMGKIQNDEDGRTSLWNDIVKHHQELQDNAAIEDFDETSVTVDIGDDKKSVVVTDNITIINTMGKLYMNVSVA